MNEFAIALLVGFRKDALVLAMLLVNVEVDVYVADLLKLNLCKQPVQMDLAVLDLRDCGRSDPFLHHAFGVDHINHRLEANKLVYLLHYNLGGLSSTDVPDSHSLGIRVIATPYLFILEANGFIGVPVVFLEHYLVE